MKRVQPNEEGVEMLRMRVVDARITMRTVRTHRAPWVDIIYTQARRCSARGVDWNKTEENTTSVRGRIGDAMMDDGIIGQ
jgi:hypothetical protein